jgi:hypothetical protein
MTEHDKFLVEIKDLLKQAQVYKCPRRPGYGYAIVMRVETSLRRIQKKMRKQLWCMG